MEIVPTHDSDEDVDLPKISDVGAVLVRAAEPDGAYRWNYEVLDYHGSAFWISEGTGFDWWLDELCEFPSPGVYVVHGIVGTYIRGDGWTTDDDEDWEFAGIRCATADEIAGECLGSPMSASQ